MERKREQSDERSQQIIQSRDEPISVYKSKRIGEEARTPPCPRRLDHSTAVIILECQVSFRINLASRVGGGGGVQSFVSSFFGVVPAFYSIHHPCSPRGLKTFIPTASKTGSACTEWRRGGRQPSACPQESAIATRRISVMFTPGKCLPRNRYGEKMLVLNFNPSKGRHSKTQQKPPSKTPSNPQ